MTLVLYPIWMDFFLQWVGLPPGQITAALCNLLGVETLQRSTILWLGASVSALMVWNAIWGGLGLFLLNSAQAFNIARVFVAALTLSMLGVLFTALLRFMESRMLRWRP